MFGKIKDIFSIDRWVENFESFLEAKIDLVKYDVKELLVDVLAKSVFFLGMAIFGLTCFLCFNFGLACLINHYLENEFGGFFILTAIYFVVTLVFYLNRNNESIKEKIELSIRASMQHQKQKLKTTKNEPFN